MTDRKPGYPKAKWNPAIRETQIKMIRDRSPNQKEFSGREQQSLGGGEDYCLCARAYIKTKHLH